MGAAYSEGIFLVRDGVNSLTGFRWNLWTLIDFMGKVRIKPNSTHPLDENQLYLVQPRRLGR